MKTYERLPYEKKTIDGRRLYKIEEGRWVSRQRAHQIWHGYSTKKHGPGHNEFLLKRSEAEKARHNKEEEPSE